MKLRIISAEQHVIYGKGKNLLFEIRPRICVLLLSVINALGGGNRVVGLRNEVFQQLVLLLHVARRDSRHVWVVDGFALAPVVFGL
jgi:hypothetical protein